MPRSREIRLKSRPAGMPAPENFELAETTVPEPGPGQILVHNMFMSVDPYMRGRMVDRPSYVPSFQVGEPLSGGAVGKVAAVNDHPQFREGDYVLNFLGWREWFLTGGGELQKVDPGLAPIHAWLGVFGMPGLTAYGGLLRA